ncbi:unnamed protein product [Ceratitis capitata]|uniref:(Mediterranean fruit fly) hypothetical protein n=1 Tax=Ceratitis capitata TaxID=7213 RepID=A0A811UPE1_CERCA|nr:unnamed protein product [Ceratitis capitata]
MFTAVYINHPLLSPAQKLYHLRYKTRGQAGDIVKRFALTNDNFQLAWDALHTRYENKRQLVDNQVSKLLNLPKVRKETVEEFIDLYSSITNSLLVLETLGTPTDSWDPILVNICSSALPESSLMLWEQSLVSRKQCPTWQQMKEFLYRQFEIVECVEHKLAKSSTSHKITKPILSPQNSHQSCKLCKKNHSLKHCKEFKKLPILQRYKFIKTNNICTNCLALYQTLKRCTSRHRCLHCQKMHNTLLHISPTHGSPCQDNHKQTHLTTPTQGMQKNAILTSTSQNIQKTVMITPDHNSRSVCRNNMQSHYSNHEKICSLHTLMNP